MYFCEHLFNIINDINIWDIKVSRNDPEIKLTGTREQLIWLFKEILAWERDCDYVTKSLDMFFVEIDLCEECIYFKLKKEFRKEI